MIVIFYFKNKVIKEENICCCGVYGSFMEGNTQQLSGVAASGIQMNTVVTMQCQR